jgi:hypothetical protein
LPQAQVDLFEEELHHAADPRGETLSPSQILARRFSDDSKNGFVLMGRYETSLRNAMLRLLRQFHAMKKEHNTTPHRSDESSVPRQSAAPSEEHLRAQADAFDRRKQALARHEPPRNEHELSIDKALWLMDQQRNRTQTKPPSNPDWSQPAGNSTQFHPSPPAKRTHRDPSDKIQKFRPFRHNSGVSDNVATRAAHELPPSRSGH